MDAIDKRDGLQQIIDNALSDMGFERKSEGFDPKAVNLAELMRKTGLTRSKARTLQKKGFSASHGSCGRKAEVTVVTGFEDELNGLLRKGVTNSAVAMERIRAAGYAGGLTMVKKYLSDNRHLVPAPRRAVAPGASRGARFETGPGEAFQMDWGFVDAEDPAGNAWRMACFAMVCHHCGTCYVEFFPNARQENLFIGMCHAFMVMGVPGKVLTDNMKSVVTRRDSEGRPVWQRDYEAFMEAAGFKTGLCRPYHPWTKGKVERLVRFVKGNFLAGRTFHDITDLNAQALDWCAGQSRRWRRIPGLVPAEEHVAECLPATSPLVRTEEVAMFMCPERRISFDGFVSYEGRRFGVPYWYEGKTARVSRDGEWLHVYSADLSTELAVHAVTWGRRDSECPGQWADQECPEELPTAPVRTRILQVAAPERPGGLDRFDFGRML